MNRSMAVRDCLTAMVARLDPEAGNKSCSSAIASLEAIVAREIPQGGECIMAQDHDSHEEGVSRRHALDCMMWAGTGVLWAVSDGASKRFSLVGRAEAASAMAQSKPTIPVILKDTTSFYWQTVIAGARKAGQDLGVNIVEL